MTDVWDLYGQIADREPNILSPTQRKLVAICDLRQEVNAGGFDNYFRAWGGNSAHDALAALPDFLGEEWAEVLRSAMSLLGHRYPSDPDERANILDKLDLNDRLSELDERFYDLEAAADADATLSAYIDGSSA